MAITLSKETIDKYEQELEEKYKRDKEGVQAMRALLSHMEAGGSASAAGSKRAAASKRTAAPKRAAAAKRAAPGKRQTLPSKIMEICDANKNQQWTMRLMLEQLRSAGYPMNQAKPEIALSNAMSNLAKKGKLAIVAKRPGRAGTLYRLGNAG